MTLGMILGREQQYEIYKKVEPLLFKRVVKANVKPEVYIVKKNK